RRLRAAAAPRAVGRNAAARRDLPGADPRPAAPLDGRAVRRARCPDTRSDDARHPGDMRARRQDRALHHALDHRGRLPLRSSPRHDAAAGPHRHDHRRGPAASAPPRGAREPGLRGLCAGDPQPVPRPRRPAGHRGAGVTRATRWASWTAPVGTLAAALIAWELVVDLFAVPEYLLPPPTGVARAMVAEWRYLLFHTWVTTKEILLGF